MKTIAIIRQTALDGQAKPDLAAVEAALRLKKQTKGSVTALSLGTVACIPRLREAVAMGCDDALLLSLPPRSSSIPEPSLYAQALARVLRSMKFDAVFTSCYAVDADTIQIGFLLASLLSLPQAGYAEDVTFCQEGGFIVKRQFEDRIQMQKLPSPCLISALLQPGKRIYMTAEGVTKAYAMEIPVIQTEGDADYDGDTLSILNKAPYITLLQSHSRKERNRGMVLTGPTEEAVAAIMDTIRKNHII